MGGGRCSRATRVSSGGSVRFPVGLRRKETVASPTVTVFLVVLLRAVRAKSKKKAEKKQMMHGWEYVDREQFQLTCFENRTIRTKLQGRFVFRQCKKHLDSSGCTVPKNPLENRYSV